MHNISNKPISFHDRMGLMENEKAVAVLHLDFSKGFDAHSQIYHKQDNQLRSRFSLVHKYLKNHTSSASLTNRKVELSAGTCFHSGIFQYFH